MQSQRARGEIPSSERRRIPRSQMQTFVIAASGKPTPKVRAAEDTLQEMMRIPPQPYQTATGGKPASLRRALEDALIQKKKKTMADASKRKEASK